MPTSSQVIQYRYLSRDFNTVASPTFQSAIQELLASRCSRSRTYRSSVKARQHNHSDGHSIYMNFISERGGYLFCEIVRSEPGAALVTVKDDDDNEVFTINQYASPDGSSPVRGTLYMLVKDDHVVYTSKGSISPRRLELYLDWLLKRVSSVLSEDANLVLNTKTPNRETFTVSEVSIDFDRIDLADVPQRPPTPREPSEFRYSIPGLNALLSVLQGHADLRRLVRLGDVDLQLLVKLRHGRSRRDVPLADVDHVFRNVDPEDIQFTGKGGKISETSPRLAGMQAVETNGSLVVIDSVRRALMNQLGIWAEEQHIAI